MLVLDQTDVPGAFKRAPERLTPEMIEQVYAVARQSTTWHWRLPWMARRLVRHLSGSCGHSGAALNRGLTSAGPSPADAD